MFEQLPIDTEGFASLKSYDGKASVHFVQDESKVGLSFRSERGILELGIGSDYSPFISLMKSPDDPPISLTVDKISGQPLVHFRTGDGKVKMFPLDKILEMLTHGR
jgi:hypothetical protein